MKKLILILLCLGLTGCVSASNISQNKNSALKNSEPERVVENDKKPFYFFTKEKELRYIAENKDSIAFWATNGDSFFQYSLGELYYYGYENTVPINYEKAFHWFNKAFQQGNFLAAFYIGEIYYDGQKDLFVKSYKEAFNWYSKLLSKESIIIEDRHCLLGCDTRQRKREDYQKKFFYQLSSETAIKITKWRIGDLYYYGRGVPQDYKQAFYWYKKLAEQGFGFAQFDLGEMYYDGKGVTQDYKQALHWYTKAAEQGDTDAQNILGGMYYDGKGVTQNYKLAYVWGSLAAAQNNKIAIKNRDMIAKELTSHQLSEAQDLAAKIQYRINNPKEPQTQPLTKTDSDKTIGTGTGFFIARDGYILTCQHVVQGASKIEIYVGNKTYTASLIREDLNNDLAILKISGSFPALAFSPHRSAKMGQEVFTVGYPNPDLQGISAKYTKGVVSSLTGFKDDLRLYQISIPIQPGNSGGALLDEYGNLLGIVVAMLNAKTAFQVSGSLPQNVNYAVKSLYAQAMIDTLPGVAKKLNTPSMNKLNAIENAQKSTVMVVCYN